MQAGVVAGAAVAVGGPYLLLTGSKAEAATIDPNTIPKYVTPLFVLPAMPPTRVLSDHLEYQVAERRMSAQVLPAGLPKSVVNGYGNPNIGSTCVRPTRVGRDRHHGHRRRTRGRTVPYRVTRHDRPARQPVSGVTR